MYFLGLDLGLVARSVNKVNWTHGTAYKLGLMADEMQIGLRVSVVHYFEYLNIGI